MPPYILAKEIGEELTSSPRKIAHALAGALVDCS
jgi:hypothetical protein